MGIIEFLFGKTKTIEDEFFGVLQFFDSKDKTKQHFEGKRSFSPMNQSIWLVIDADFSGPTNEQKQFFRRIEDQYWYSPVKVEGWKRVALTTQTTKCNDHQEDVFEGI